MAAACTSSAGPIRMADRPADIPDTAISSLLFTYAAVHTLDSPFILADPAGGISPDGSRSLVVLQWAQAQDAPAVAAWARVRNARTASAGSDAP
ncbi:hypothetical protein GCM10018772_48170 [Streptomyces fumanus]|uniref:Uncharacterized protein n=1 Tax=Streptomyces fumanus TaxID=67302 RepID=A0A919APN6_9ACTN|nr:hypothetical protein GCM10018772_48170 [Streptomyces fumanus]